MFNFLIVVGIILLIILFNNCSEKSYFGSGPLIFSPDNSSDSLIDNNRLEPVYQKIKLASYL